MDGKFIIKEIFIIIIVSILTISIIFFTYGHINQKQNCIGKGGTISTMPPPPPSHYYNKIIDFFMPTNESTNCCPGLTPQPRKMLMDVMFCE